MKGWPKGKKRGPQSPAQIEKMKAARAVAFEERKKTVRVSRNDAAMLEVLRTVGSRKRELKTEIEAMRIFNPDGSSGIPGPASRHLFRELEEKSQSLDAIFSAWLDGEDVLLAKLAQQ